MTEAKHTPGPWGAVAAGNQFSIIPVNAKEAPRNGRKTDDIVSGSKLHDDWEANAALIAAAPDLLAAPEAILAKHDDRDAPSDLWPREAQLARAAIAKESNRGGRVMTEAKPRKEWSFTKCPCGHRGCNQYIISAQGTVGFEEDDARLIVAAPDLLAVVEEALSEYEQIGDFDHPVAKAARAAIAKAKGEAA